MSQFNKFHYFQPSEIFSKNNKKEILDIITNDNVSSNMVCLLQLLEAFRTLFFNEPITITSFFRNKLHNKKVGGVANSYHMLGAAVDVTCSNIPSLLSELDAYSDVIKYIYYADKNFVHIQLLNPKR